MTEKPFLIELAEKNNDKPGKLVAINNFEINMDIKRIFYIYGFGDDINLNNRGYHSHKNTTQILILLNGSVCIKTKNKENIDEQVFNLCKPNIALKVPPNNFIKLLEFSKDAVLLVLCDTLFKDDIYEY